MALNQMDAERHKMMFDELQKECEWKDEMNLGGTDMVICHGGNVPCQQNQCMPFKFALYINKSTIY